MRLSTVTKTFSAFALSLGMLTMSAQVQAEALNLDLVKTTPAPDTLSTLMNTAYTSADGLLTVTQNSFSAFSFRDETGTAHDVTDGTFKLIAEIGSDGSFFGGEFTIGGTVASLVGYDSGTLLSGNLSAFGYSVNSTTFEFTFDSLSGDALSLYTANNYSGGMVMDDTGFNNTFESDFGEANLTKIDTGVISAVPEPSTLALFGLGLFTVAAFARRQSARKA